MTRPPGQTATLDTRVLAQAPLSIDDTRLDAEAEAWIDERWQELRDAGRPVSKRTIRTRLLAEWARELDPEPETSVLTVMRRGGQWSGSVPVDRAVGERVARQMAGAR